MSDPQDNEQTPKCVKFGCDNTELVNVKQGGTLQTNNGFVINCTPGTRHICPNCAGYYHFQK